LVLRKEKEGFFEMIGSLGLGGRNPQIRHFLSGVARLSITVSVVTRQFELHLGQLLDCSSGDTGELAEGMVLSCQAPDWEGEARESGFHAE